MEQHPVPQNISSYEFRLVGDMTLRQFGYLAAGGAVALFFYALPIMGIIKWFLILTSAFVGFALAFMPIEERPLVTWIWAFLKAIFSPTVFVWRKTPVKPEIFTPVVLTPPTKPQLGPTDKTQLNEYLRTLPSQKPLSKTEQHQEIYLQQISGLFQPGKVILPPEKVISIPITPITLKPEPKKVVFKPVVFPEKPIVLPEKPGRKPQPTVIAKLSSELPIPAPPTRPNLLVGMVLNANNEIIEGAIIEIRNSQGMPVRALKTNKLGQFFIATPLENDVYEIETEKEGYLFDIIKLETKGKIIQPIEIRAKQKL